MDTAPTTAASTPTCATAATTGPAGLLLLQPLAAAAVDSGQGRGGMQAGCGMSDAVTFPAYEGEYDPQPAGVAPPHGLPSRQPPTCMPTAAATGIAFGSAGLGEHRGKEEETAAAEADVVAAAEAEAAVCVWREDIVPAGLRERRLYSPSFAEELHLVAAGRALPTSAAAVTRTARPCVAGLDTADSEEGLPTPPAGPARIPMAATAMLPRHLELSPAALPILSPALASYT